MSPRGLLYGNKMSRKGLISDRLKPAWDALDQEQQTCWHFAAMKKPRLSNAANLRTENGWQYFIDVNSALATVDESYILSDPPANDDPPAPIETTTALWPLPSKLAAGGSTKKPKPWTQLALPVPQQVTGIVTQTYDEFLGAHAVRPLTGRIICISENATGWLRAGDPPEYVTTDKEHLEVPGTENRSTTPRVRHVTTLIPDQEGTITLDEPAGYYATTAGANRFATIKGVTARRRPDLPLGKLRTINLTNGEIVKTTLTNPTGTT